MFSRVLYSFCTDTTCFWQDVIRNLLHTFLHAFVLLAMALTHTDGIRCVCGVCMLRTALNAATFACWSSPAHTVYNYTYILRLKELRKSAKSIQLVSHIYIL